MELNISRTKNDPLEMKGWNMSGPPNMTMNQTRVKVGQGVIHGKKYNANILQLPSQISEYKPSRICKEN